MRMAVTKAAVLAMLAATTAGAATAMKNPLYGDPAHPNISGMWNPEFAYFGPPIADAANPARRRAAPRGRPAAAAGPPAWHRPPMPQLTPAYAKKVRRVAQEVRDRRAGPRQRDTLSRVRVRTFRHDACGDHPDAGPGHDEPRRAP